jgi:hypothetical protein
MARIYRFGDTLSRFKKAIKQLVHGGRESVCAILDLFEVGNAFLERYFFYFCELNIEIVTAMAQSDTIQQIPLDKLGFDKDNPRLPKSIGRSETNILEWMLNKENIIELMNSIGEKGFFPGEPILVISDGKDGYIVIEGNRRFTASLLLSFPDKAPIKKVSVNDVSNIAKEKPQTLPALVFSSREDILDYLGYRHITGVEAWDALAKARYLAQLNERLGASISQKDKYVVLAKQIGSKSPYVRQLLLGKQLYDAIESENFYDISGLDDKSFEFGTFYTAIVKPNIAKYAGVDIENDDPLKDLNSDHLKDLTKWMFERNSENQTRLGESRNLGKLNKILDENFSTALKAFKDDGVSLSVAADLTDEADEIVSKQINDAQLSLELAWSYLPKVMDYSSIDKERLKSISKLVKLIYDNLVEKQANNSGLDEI